MRTEKELEPVADAIRWLMERGNTSEATRLLQSCQKEGLEHARTLEQASSAEQLIRDDRRKSEELIQREMAALRC